MSQSVSTPEAPERAKKAPRLPKWKLLIAGLAVLCPTLAYAWHAYIEPNVFPKRWGVVEQGKIYRSGAISPRLIYDVLHQHNIGVIVDLTGEVPGDRQQQAERDAAATLGVEIKRCPLIGDGTGDIAQYAAAIKNLAEARRNGKPALVHCSAGAQRTGGVVAAYRLLVEGAAPEMVYSEMQEYGWQPRKDTILPDYLNSHMQELARRLQQSGVIDRVPEPLPKLGP